jgi:hypothetical protein
MIFLYKIYRFTAAKKAVYDKPVLWYCTDTAGTDPTTNLFCGIARTPPEQTPQTISFRNVRAILQNGFAVLSNIWDFG